MNDCNAQAAREFLASQPAEPFFWHDGQKVMRYFGNEEPREATPEELAKLNKEAQA